MNGFRCNVTGSVSNVGLAPAKLPRRCGADPERGVMEATPGNCTYGAKQPFYWFQKERNNVRVPARLRRSAESLILFSFRVDVRRHLFSAFLLGPLQLQRRRAGRHLLGFVRLPSHPRREPDSSPYSHRSSRSDGHLPAIFRETGGRPEVVGHLGHHIVLGYGFVCR